MKQTIIDLKQRIEKNYRRLQRKYPPTKVALDHINNFLSQNASDEKIKKWLDDHDNVVFSIESFLDIIEK